MTLHVYIVFDLFFNLYCERYISILRDSKCQHQFLSFIKKTLALERHNLNVLPFSFEMKGVCNTKAELLYTFFRVKEHSTLFPN